MGKIIKQAIFFFTRISLPAVSSTTGARFLPYHHVQQEAGFRDRTSRRCCKLCRQSKHLHTYHQWEKKRILLPAVSFTTTARFSVIIICNMRTEEEAESHDRTSRTKCPKKKSVLPHTVYQDIVQSIPNHYTGRITICRRRQGSMTEPFGGSANCVDSANRGG